MSFRRLPKTYAALIRYHVPRPIHDEVGYSETVEVMDAFAIARGHLNKDQRDYLEVLTQLVESYDQQNYPEPPKASPSEVLKFLLRENGIGAAQLMTLLGVEESTVYKILKGARQLTVAEIANICRRFQVSADLFIPGRVGK